MNFKWGNGGKKIGGLPNLHLSAHHINCKQRFEIERIWRWMLQLQCLPCLCSALPFLSLLCWPSENGCRGAKMPRLLHRRKFIQSNPAGNIGGSPI